MDNDELFEPLRIPFDAYCPEHLKHHTENEIPLLHAFMTVTEHDIHCSKCGFHASQPNLAYKERDMEPEERPFKGQYETAICPQCGKEFRRLKRKNLKQKCTKCTNEKMLEIRKKKVTTTKTLSVQVCFTCGKTIYCMKSHYREASTGNRFCNIRCYRHRNPRKRG